MHIKCNNFFIYFYLHFVYVPVYVDVWCGENNHHMADSRRSCDIISSMTKVACVCNPDSVEKK
jgi:hypothetical protein